MMFSSRIAFRIVAALSIAAATTAAAIGCSDTAPDDDDGREDAGKVQKDATAKYDAGTPDTSTPDPDTGTTPTFAPECAKAGAPFTGLPRLNDAVVDAGYNVVCCAGNLTDLSMPEHCGGCGINCNTGGNAYVCQTFVGDAGPHSYCTGCKAKFAGDQDAANASCQTGLCSGSAPFASEGRCAPSNGSNDCVDTVCTNAYMGAQCARYADAAPMRDPAFYCTYK